MRTYFKNSGQRYGGFGEVVMRETHIIIYLQFLTMCLVQNKGIRKWKNEKIRKWGNEVNTNNTRNANNTTKGNGRVGVFRRVGQVRGGVGGLGRKRRRMEEGKESFWWKKAVRRVGLAYRELIGSLYESWTIGIGRVYK